MWVGELQSEILHCNGIKIFMSLEQTALIKCCSSPRRFALVYFASV